MRRNRKEQRSPASELSTKGIFEVRVLCQPGVLLNSFNVAVPSCLIRFMDQGKQTWPHSLFFMWIYAPKNHVVRWDGLFRILGTRYWKLLLSAGQFHLFWIVYFLSKKKKQTNKQTNKQTKQIINNRYDMKVHLSNPIPTTLYQIYKIGSSLIFFFRFSQLSFFCWIFIPQFKYMNFVVINFHEYQKGLKITTGNRHLAAT